MAEAEKACEEGMEEYESDLDDGPLSVARRRGAASEEEKEEEGCGGSSRGSPPPSTVSGSESDDSDGQGAAELYDEEEVYGTEEEEDVEYEEAHEESGDSDAGFGGGESAVVNGEVSLAADEGKHGGDEAAVEGDEEGEAAMKREEVKKASDSEPYAVPTAGYFYEHDIRFQGQEDGNRGYRRQNFGGQKIWDPKEEAVWVHDLFNEINLHNNKHDNRQFHSYYDNAKGYNDERNMYRERGSRTTQSCRTTSRISSAQNNIKSYSRSQDAEPAEVSYNAGVEKHSSQRSLPHEQNLPCNQIFLPNKSSAPPPFYSATRSSSHRELPYMQREKACCVTFNKLSSAVHKAHLQHEQTLPFKQTFGSNISSAPPPFYSATRSSSHRELHFMPREKACCVTFNKLFSSAVHKAHLQHEQTLPCKQTFGSNISSAPPPFYSSRSSDQRYYTQPCNAVYHQRSVQRPILPTPRASAEIFVQKVTSTKKTQSHPQTTLVSSSGDGEATAPPESNSSVVLSAATGHDGMNEAERTHFLGGSLVLGNTGVRSSMLDDPGSNNTTTKLPVMLFSGLHPRGPGLPSDAMVLPEFVDQRRGDNSEMRPMACESGSPILTGATGVQEGAISPPYFGSNCLQHCELASSLASPSDHGVKKGPISPTSQDPMSLAYQKIPEVKGHEFVHLQNRTRRYSEMSFAL